MLKRISRAELLAKARAQLVADKGANKRDPLEFRPPRVKPGEEKIYYFRILPMLQKGETCIGGVSQFESKEAAWYYRNGQHILGKEWLSCPRTFNDEECPICQFGFDLMRDNTDKAYRSKVAKQYLSQQRWCVNIYLLNTNSNPEELRGQVMRYNLPKTVFDKMEACINADEAGGDSEDDEKKAFGIFYDVFEGYTFKLVVKEKSDYNNYEESRFLPKSLGPIVKDSDEAAIEEILNRRISLPTKFAMPDVDKLEAALSKLQNREQSGGEDEEDADENIGGAVKGGAASSTPRVAPKAAPKAPPPEEEDEEPAPAPAKPAKPVAESVEEPEEEEPAPTPAPKAKPVIAKKTQAKPVDADEDAELAGLMSQVKKQ